MSNVIDQNTYYNIQQPSVWRGCCDSIQFQYFCKAHDEAMGCYFCDFSYTNPCDCPTTEGK